LATTRFAASRARGEGDLFVGISPGPYDPTVAVVIDGRIVALVEEERLVRQKHAYGLYPIRSLDYCLESVGRRLDEVTRVAIPWDVQAYSDGTVATFFDKMADEFRIDARTRDWQVGVLRRFQQGAVSAQHRYEWRRRYGDVDFPQVCGVAHHYSHAFQAAMQSPYDSAVTVTIDGSGDTDTAVVWLKTDERLEAIRKIRMPHSLGWFYAAFTEYLGFEAYDGEYKLMGLAAYGHPSVELSNAVSHVLLKAEDGVEFRLDPTSIMARIRTQGVSPTS
jgi:carbamoyltransferase